MIYNSIADRKTSSSLTPSTGHMENINAYNILDKRICKIKGQERPYHFCSPTFTEMNPNLKYLGEGKIHSINDEVYNGNDKNESLHFWIRLPKTIN